MPKLDPATKQAIRERLAAGFTVDQIKQDFPAVDGRQINGMRNQANLAHVPRGQNPQAAPSIVSPPPAAPPDTGTPPPGPAAPAFAGPTAPPPTPTTTIPMTPSSVDQARATGFTPVPGAQTTEGGFTPSWADFYIVKKLDDPGAGIVGNELPPFTVSDFLRKYSSKPGQYEITHYRNGRVYAMYRDAIAPSSSHPNGQVNGSGLTFFPGAQPAKDPALLMIEAMRMSSDMQAAAETRAEARARTLFSDEKSVKMAKEQAEANVTQTAIASVATLAGQMVNRPPAEPQSMSLMLTFLQAQQTQAQQAHQQQMDILEKKLQREREKDAEDRKMERERMELERQRIKQEADERTTREREFLAKMKEIEEHKQTVFTEYYNKSVTDLQGYQKAALEEFQRARTQAEEYAKLQRAHVEEVIQLKKTLSGDDKDLDKLKVIAEGLKGVAQILQSGKVNSLLALPGSQPATAQAVQPGQTPPPTAKEEKQMDFDEMLKGEFFQRMQEEIYLHIKVKKHGKVMAMGFWDQMLRDAKARAAYLFLAVRDWSMIMDKCRPYIKPEYLKVLESPEASAWYDQFISVVNHEYEARTAPQSAATEEPKAPAPSPATEPQAQQPAAPAKEKEAANAPAT